MRRRTGTGAFVLRPARAPRVLPAPVENTPPSAAPRAHTPLLPPRARTFWQRRIRDPIVVQLTQGITPEKIALTFAVGSACALFPVFGVTSLLCFVAALVWRLNQPIIQILNQLLFPVHVAAFLLCVRLGEMLFRVPAAERLTLYPWKMHEQYFEGFWSHPLRSLGFFLQDNADSVAYSIVAWALLLPLYVPLVYYSLRPVMRGIVKVKAEVAAKKAATAPPPSHPVP